MTSTSTSTTTTSTGAATTVSTIVGDVATIVGAIAPAIDAANPAIGAALTIAGTILKGVGAAEPEAVALFDQIAGGTPPTAAQLVQYAAAETAAYAQLQADISALGG